MTSRLGQFLRASRKAKRLSLRQVTAHSDICYGILCRIEHGKFKPKFEYIVKLSELYGVRLERLAQEARKDMA
jgi:transcriptional regulator with XRE-family HTH domain